MDKVLLDTNVLIDFLATARPGHGVAVDLMQRVLDDGFDLCVVATSLKDVYYILGRVDGESVARQAVESIMAVATILPVDDACCRVALASTEPDFEDGIIRAAAEIAQVRYLVSRDHHAFAGSWVPRIAPADLLREWANG